MLRSPQLAGRSPGRVPPPTWSARASPSRRSACSCPPAPWGPGFARREGRVRSGSRGRFRRHVALDAGSTDSGPRLSPSFGRFRNTAARRCAATSPCSWRPSARCGRSPCWWGLAVLSGCDPALDWTVDIALEIAGAQGARPRIAVLRSEQDREAIKARLADGLITPLAPRARASHRGRGRRL